MKLKQLLLIFTGVILLSIFFTACAAKETNTEPNNEDTVTEVVKINVTSESIDAEGKLLSTTTAFSKSLKHTNESPQLSWDLVKGASCYAIYMYDRSANDWLHWKVGGLTQTSLAQGEDIPDSQYIGPYPPSGTHNYEIIVYALANAPDNYSGVIDKPSSRDNIEKELDTLNGKTGNIIGKGSVVGKFSRNDAN